MAASSWLRRSVGDAEPAVRLLCFPHAGGGASSFNAWRQALPGYIELVKVQLPGREDRRDDQAHTRMDDLVEDLFPHVLPLLDRPLVFYGHSVGSLVAFEVTRALRKHGHASPLALLISSRRAPHRPLRDAHLLHTLSDQGLAGRVEQLGGIPPGLLANVKWRSHFLPRIRADLSLSDTYAHEPGPQLDCPLHTFIGEHDDLVAHEDWEAWSDLAGGEFTRRVLPGGHFFSTAGQAEIIAEITRVVALSLARHAAGLGRAGSGRGTSAPGRSPVLGETMRVP